MILERLRFFLLIGREWLSGSRDQSPPTLTTVLAHLTWLAIRIATVVSATTVETNVTTFSSLRSFQLRHVHASPHPCCFSSIIRNGLCSFSYLFLEPSPGYANPLVLFRNLKCIEKSYFCHRFSILIVIDTARRFALVSRAVRVGRAGIDGI